MFSKLPLLSLFLVLSVYGQSRPTGNIVDPEEYSEKEVSEKEQLILATVKQNMGMCSDGEVPLNSMKDLYTHLNNIQNKKAVKDIDQTDQVANKDDPNCAKPKFAIVSFEVTCLLSGAEEPMYAFSQNKSSSIYLEKKLGVSKKAASEMLQFMEFANKPGYDTAIGKKKKIEMKYQKAPIGDDGKI